MESTNQEILQLATRQEQPRQCMEIEMGQANQLAEPPCELIPRALNKFQHDKATEMLCLPMWKSAPLYIKMVNMMQAEPHIIKEKPIYRDPEGKNMPPPRWATLITILQG